MIAVKIKNVLQSPCNQSTTAPEDEARTVLHIDPIDARAAYWVDV